MDGAILACVDEINRQDGNGIHATMQQNCVTKCPEMLPARLRIVIR